MNKRKKHIYNEKNITTEQSSQLNEHVLYNEHCNMYYEHDPLEDVHGCCNIKPNFRSVRKP